MRILHVIPTYVPAWRYGGLIVAAHGLCRALARCGHDVHVFTTSVNGPDDLNVPPATPVDVEGVKVWYFPPSHMRRLYWSPDLRRELSRQISTFALVHLHSVFLWPTWAAARAASLRSVPYVVSPHGMLVRELIARKSRLKKTLWIRLIEKHTLENASAIHVTSTLEAQELEYFDFRLPNVAVIPHGVEADPGHSPGPLDVSLVAQKPFFLFLSRINWKKGLDRLIPALAFAPDVNLIVAGNDDENCRPQLEALAAKQGVSERVHFIGPVYGSEKQALIKHATALVLPSYSENFGIVVLEAMAAGCPVVVTEAVGLADVVRASGAGIVSAGDPPVLGGVLQRLLTDADGRRQMGERGRKIAAEHYSWDVVAAPMEALYQDIIAGRVRQ